MFSRCLKIALGCACCVLFVIQYWYYCTSATIYSLKLITITYVYTQDVESQAAEPTEQSTRVLESKTKSMIFLLMYMFVFWLCVGLDYEIILCHLLCWTCTILDITTKD